MPQTETTPDPSTSKIPRRPRPRLTRLTTPFLLMGILLFAFYLRHATFWLPHWQGDQSQHVTLAMKMSVEGMTGYHLRNASIRIRTHPIHANWKFIYPQYAEGDTTGDFFKAYAEHELEFYNMPFFYKGPLFPAVLSFAHRWFTTSDHPFIVVHENLGREALHSKPLLMFYAQAWAVAVPLVQSLLTVLATFFIGRMLFDSRAGLYAAFLMAIHPVSIVASNRLLNEAQTTLLTTLSFLVYWTAHKRNSLLGLWVAGALNGFALLTNQKTILFWASIALYSFLTSGHSLRRASGVFRRGFNRSFWVFVFGSMFVATHWFWMIYKIYGHSFWQPGVGHLMSASDSGWYGLVLSRPPALILFAVGIPFICPGFGAAYFSLKGLVRDLRETLARNARTAPYAFLWLWILPTYFYMQLAQSIAKEGMEHRYLLMVYPALAVLAGQCLLSLKTWLSDRTGSVLWAQGAVLLILFASAVWSIPIAMDTIFEERFLIKVPF